MIKLGNIIVSLVKNDDGECKVFDFVGQEIDVRFINHVMPEQFIIYNDHTTWFLCERINRFRFKIAVGTGSKEAHNSTALIPIMGENLKFDVRLVSNDLNVFQIEYFVIGE